ncbi:hypothetical protein FQR65_LT12200 [Abscondita terminalis]|nr:hypothetical protein FQR65_LT12200 [Abscondita terminalis]
MKIVWISLSKEKVCQWVASLCVILITTCTGCNFGWTSPYIPFLLSEESSIRLTDEEGSWIAVIYLIAGLCGAITSAFTSNVFGRKPTLIFASAIFVVSWLMLTFASTYAELLVVRFIAGGNEGLIFVTATAYLAEIADKKIRGFFCSLISVASITGVLIINILGSRLTIRDSSLVCMTLPITFLLIFIWMPESPHYLLAKGKAEIARKCLAKIRPLAEIEEELADISKSVEEDKTVKFTDLFLSKTYRINLLIVMGLQSFQQLSGICAIIFYAQTVFEETTNALSPLTAVVILHSVEIIVSFISSVLIDKIGRRPLLISSITVAALTLLVVGAYFLIIEEFIKTKIFEWLPISCLVVFIVVYSIGLQTIPTFIAGEIFPTNLRTHAVAFSNVFYFLAAFVVSKFFQVTKDVYGMNVSFLTFSACSFLGLIFIIYFVPETKNKSLREIQLELKKINS